MNKAILLVNVTTLFPHIFTGDATDLIWSFNKFLKIPSRNKVLITQVTTLTKNWSTLPFFFFLPFPPRGVHPNLPNKSEAAISKLKAKSGQQPSSVDRFLLEDSHDDLFKYCLWLFLYYNSTVEQSQQRTHDLQCWKHLLSSRKSLLTLV